MIAPRPLLRLPGAVNRSVFVFAPVKATAVPPTWLQAKPVIAKPFGPLPLPISVTADPDGTV